MKRRIFIAFCVLVLLLGVAPQAGAVDIKVYQLALNERFMDSELTTTNMPVSVNGTIYIPYTAFDRSITGVDLGVFYGQEKTDDTYRLTLYSRSGIYLTFDLLEQTCYLTREGQKEAQSMRAIIRYDKVYVPASSVCRVFGLQYTYTATRTAGDLIRIKSSSSALSDAAFLDAAATYMQNRYDEYIKSLTPVPTLAPVPTAAPTSNGNPGGSVVTTPPAVSQAPQQEPETDGGTEKALILAFYCQDGQGLDQILEILGREQIYALFLFPADRVEEQRAAVRKVLGDGHAVGLTVSGSQGADLLAELEAGNGALSRYAWYRSHVALAEEADQDAGAALKEAGWSLWTGDVDGRPRANGTLATHTILNQIEWREGQVTLTLDDSAATAQGLSALLQRLSEDGCTFLSAMETQMG